MSFCNFLSYILNSAEATLMNLGFFYIKICPCGTKSQLGIVERWYAHGRIMCCSLFLCSVLALKCEIITTNLIWGKKKKSDECRNYHSNMWHFLPNECPLLPAPSALTTGSLEKYCNFHFKTLALQKPSLCSTLLIIREMQISFLPLRAHSSMADGSVSKSFCLL